MASDLTNTSAFENAKRAVIRVGDARGASPSNVKALPHQVVAGR
jgi:hypothetical protein